MTRAMIKKAFIHTVSRLRPEWFGAPHASTLYPPDCPAFTITSKCHNCDGLHTTGAPTQYGGVRIDVYSCCWFEPYDLWQLVPLTESAREMVKIAVLGGVEYGAKRRGRWKKLELAV